ncbi:MAG: hypothetical protein ORN26_02205 [Candidatus Pacebacteria bacterium]|nr:hypothetical protein [Candidatus Paceibacterota bacterium]
MNIIVRSIFIIFCNKAPVVDQALPIPIREDSILGKTSLMLKFIELLLRTLAISVKY